MLDCLLAIEHRMGRIRRQRWGPRRIDLDLLAYGQVQVASPKLHLPHPRLHERAFVLLPWCELNPDFCPWVGGPSVAELLSALADADRTACWPVGKGHLACST
jgi:2-amino-4-hydroxy-6-hydroxymethyldihydropteridine diphosphokinase